VIFIDSNIPMYLVGAAHPHKEDAARLVERAVVRRERLITDAEVLQEILHRYSAIQRLDAVQPAFEVLLRLVDEVVDVTVDVVIAAKEILLGRSLISARDAVHVAAMTAAGASRIMSFDRGFDRYPGLERLA
jgi:predicted nucleic acid-binding protein